MTLYLAANTLLDFHMATNPYLVVENGSSWALLRLWAGMSEEFRQSRIMQSWQSGGTLILRPNALGLTFRQNQLGLVYKGVRGWKHVGVDPTPR